MEGRRLLKILEKLDPGIILFDDNLSVKYINRVILLTFSEFSKEELFTSDIMGLHDVKAQNKIKAMLRLMKDSSRPVPFSFKRISAHNKDHYLFIKLIPLLSNNNDENLNCMLVYDITPYITNQEQTFIKIPVTLGKEIYLIDPVEILYIKAENVYSKIYTIDGEYLCDFSLLFLEERLPTEYFYRIHRSYIINLTKIEKVIKDGQSYLLQLQGCDVSLPISRSKVADFSKKIGLK
ncbi:LytTR family transcriptional regulator [Deferribacter autotrophicus]|uniref:LytTR family transcriptional regulator n=1 Tax=Deferribacter autotrophicus TaxID=500465 RepID=A0A5A8EZF6_9BACT|nr:LytTR family DNA-binding domain-containing protein [Deferribacter autotrophicus]KAA0256873.1 LytTR family transcriptional regulator [Deferribacter autotrophicus]